VTDEQQQRPERYGDGANHGDTVLSIEGVGLSDISTDLDGAAVSGQGLGAEYDEADGPGLSGRFRQRVAAPLWAAREPESEAERIVREAVKGMTSEQQETFRLVFGERKSYAEAAELLGVTKASVQGRVETLKRIVERALVQAAGGEAVSA
jgi:predicted DNA-binding protein (UPF0251 family)